MKFAFLSSALLAATATTQVQAQQHKMRGGIVVGGRGLKESFDGELSLSMSMPVELASVELGTTAAVIEAKAKADTASYKSKSSKSPKSEKTGVCDHRLDILFDQLADIQIFDLDEEDINELCHYQPDGIHPDLPDGPNFGCSFGFFPLAQSEADRWSQGNLFFWQPFVEAQDEAEVYQALEMYCECHVGIDDGCAAKIPREEGDKKWLEYCKGVGVWNGDFLLEDVKISEEVEQCGCYFIGATRDKVDACPGVNLGEFFCDNEGFGSICD